MFAKLHSVFAVYFRRTLTAIAIALLAALAGSSPVLALPPNDGDLIVADVSSARLIRVDFNGGVADVLASGGLLTGTSGVAVERTTGGIFTTNQLNLGGPGQFGRIIKVDTPSLAQTLVADGRGNDAVFGGIDGQLRYPRHLDFEAGGTLVVAERNQNFQGQTPRNGIVRFDPASANFDTNTTDVRVAPTGAFIDPLAVLAAPQGHLFLGDQGATGLWYVPANGASQTALDGLIVGDVSSVGGLTIGATDGAGHVTSLFVAEFGAARVSRVDLVYAGDTVISGVRTTISTGTGPQPMSQPTGVVYDEMTGFLYAVDAGGTNDGVFRIANPFGPFAAGNTTYLNILTASGGAITAASLTPNGIDVFYFAPPVPEPSTFALLGLGSVGLGIRTRRNRRAAQ